MNEEERRVTAAAGTGAQTPKRYRKQRSLRVRATAQGSEHPGLFTGHTLPHAPPPEEGRRCPPHTCALAGAAEGGDSPCSSLRVCPRSPLGWNSTDEVTQSAPVIHLPKWRGWRCVCHRWFILPQGRGR